MLVQNNYCLGLHDTSTGECIDRNWTTSFSCAPYSKNANTTHGSMCASGSLSFNVTSCPPCAKPDPKTKKCPPCEALTVNATITAKDATTLVFTPQAPLPPTANGAPISSSCEFHTLCLRSAELKARCFLCCCAAAFVLACSWTCANRIRIALCVVPDGWGALPMFTVYDKQTNLPLLGWQEPRDD